MAVDVLRCRSCPSSVTDDVITHLLNVRTFDVYSNHVTKILCKTPVCLKINIFHFHFSLHATFFSVAVGCRSPAGLCGDGPRRGCHRTRLGRLRPQPRRVSRPSGHRRIQVLTLEQFRPT